MKFFENEHWRAFWINFLAVLLGIFITFGGERIISEYQEDQDAKEIIGLFKTDVRHHLSASSAMMHSIKNEMRCLRQAAQVYNDSGDLSQVPVDTLEIAMHLFFSVRSDVFTPMGITMLEVSGALAEVDDMGVVESISRISNMIPSFWRQYDKMFSSITSAKQHLYETGRLKWQHRGSSKREMLEYRFRCLMEDNLCSGLINRGTVNAYLRMFDHLDKHIRKELADIEQAGY